MHTLSCCCNVLIAVFDIDCAALCEINCMCLHAGNVAPIHPGSIPSPGIGSSSVAQLALQSRTSIGGGISPVLLAQVIHLTRVFV